MNDKTPELLWDKTFQMNTLHFLLENDKFEWRKYETYGQVITIHQYQI